MMGGPAVKSELAAKSATPERGRRGLLIFAACWLLLALFGWVDYITGYELGFFVFYSLPVGLAAWYLGRWPGVIVALGATVTWWMADSLAGAKYSSQFSFWWNSTIHFSAFVINAVTIARIRLDLKHRDRLASRLEAARKALRAATGALPSCPVCGRARPAACHESQAELERMVRADADLKAVVCGGCGAEEALRNP